MIVSLVEKARKTAAERINEMSEIENGMVKFEITNIAVLGFGKLGKRVINLGVDGEENGLMGRYIESHEFLSEENSLYYSKVLGSVKILFIVFDWDSLPVYTETLIEAAKKKGILILGIASGHKVPLSVCEEPFAKMLSYGMDAIYSLDEESYYMYEDYLCEELAKQTILVINKLINVPCVINMEYHDVSVILGGAKRFNMGIGYGKGEDKGAMAAKRAMECGWNTLNVNEASKFMFLVTGDVTLTDVSDVAEFIREHSKHNADIIFGAMYSEEEEDACQVVMLAAEFAN